MTRTLLAIAALAVAAAAPASAYTPNPEDYTYPKRPCLKCGFAVKPGTIYINPGVKYRILSSRFDKVALNPQPLPPKALGKIVR